MFFPKLASLRSASALGYSKTQFAQDTSDAWNRYLTGLAPTPDFSMP